MIRAATVIALLVATVVPASAVSYITREIVARGGGVTPFMWQFWAGMGGFAAVFVATFFLVGWALGLLPSHTTKRNIPRTKNVNGL